MTATSPMPFDRCRHRPPCEAARAAGTPPRSIRIAAPNRQSPAQRDAPQSRCGTFARLAMRRRSQVAIRDRRRHDDRPSSLKLLSTLAHPWQAEETAEKNCFNGESFTIKFFGIRKFKLEPFSSQRLFE